MSLGTPFRMPSVYNQFIICIADQGHGHMEPRSRGFAKMNKNLVGISSFTKADEITTEVCQKKAEIYVQVRGSILIRTISSA